MQSPENTTSHQAGRALRHRFEGPFFRKLMIGGIRHIPQRVQRLTMPMWGSLFWALLPKARHAAASNLDHVLGSTSPLQRSLRTRQLFLNYSQMMADTYAVHLGRPLELDVTSLGRHHLLDAAAEGKGVIAATGHIGMWQVGPFLAEWRSLPRFYMAMAEEPNPLVQQYEERFRGRFNVIYTTSSPFSVLKLAQVLREGSIVGMQMDRHLGGHTHQLKFCGHDAWFPTGPAVLARSTGAPLVPSFFVVEPPQPGDKRRRITHLLDAAITVPHTRDRAADIAEATEKLVAAYQRVVSRYPTQWYQFYDFFLPPAAPAASESLAASRESQTAGSRS
ncbi:MAG TPA: lysophospholipid acyltransferase family protein [Pseudomonadota bacterium]|nr:lysophospholipid acyltransferase family protein [Pseudomonadota bacterium]